jgi:hypothetical protein
MAHALPAGATSTAVLMGQAKTIAELQTVLASWSSCGEGDVDDDADIPYATLLLTTVWPHSR